MLGFNFSVINQMNITPSNIKFLILEFLKISHLLPFNKRKSVITFYYYVPFLLSSMAIRNASLSSSLVHSSEYGYYISNKYCWKLILINFNEKFLLIF